MKKKLTVLPLLLASLAYADPTPQEIVDKTTEAAGGKEKLASVKGVSLMAMVSIPAQGINGTIELLKAPGKILVVTQIPGIGDVRVGLNDGIAYEQTDLMGTRLLSDEETKQVTQGIESTEQVDRLSKLRGLRVTGSEKIEGRDVWKVVGKNDRDDDEEYWIDAEKYRILRVKMVVRHQVGRMETIMHFSDFKTIDGIELPMTTRTQVGPSELVMKIAKVEFNPKIDDAKFALPAEVRRLAEQRKSTTGPTTRPKDGE